jgi:hypothetical protein
MIQAATVTTYLSAFSDEIPIPKPLILKGTCKWLGSLFRNKPNRSFEQGRAYTKRPDGKVCGQAELQATQQYPWAFGEAVWRSKCIYLIYVFIILFVYSFFVFKQTSKQAKTLTNFIVFFQLQKITQVAAGVLSCKDSALQCRPAILSQGWQARAASEEDDNEAIRWVRLAD